MKAPVVAIAFLFVAGCASQPVNTGQRASTGSLVRYECFTYVGSNHVLTLPIPESDAATPLVQITLHGDRIPAIYQRQGLTQLWSLDESLYIQLDPDLVARYMNFKGAEQGEKRKAEAVFKCEKRK
jgi:hypothetical protein